MYVCLWGGGGGEGGERNNRILHLNKVLCYEYPMLCDIYNVHVPCSGWTTECI